MSLELQLIRDSRSAHGHSSPLSRSAYRLMGHRTVLTNAECKTLKMITHEWNARRLMRSLKMEKSSARQVSVHSLHPRVVDGNLAIARAVFDISFACKKKENKITQLVRE